MIYGMKKLHCSHVVVELLFVGVGDVLHSEWIHAMSIYMCTNPRVEGFQGHDNQFARIGPATSELSIWPIHRIIGDTL